jgi:NADH-quinone oxidoreductase subunit J
LTIIDEILLIVLVAAALWTVMSRSLLRSAIGLALSSAILSVIMFRLGSPIAAVFELSVCAGLISALFFCIITITEPLTPEKVIQEWKARLERFWYLPVTVLFAGLVLRFIKVKIDIKLPPPEKVIDVRSLLWEMRQLDLIGQIIILLCGVFGIVILLKELRKKNG